MRRVLASLRPSPIRLAVTVILLILSLLLTLNYEATSKVSWVESRGVPLSILTLSGYQGPCPPVETCKKIEVQRFDPFALILDTIALYIVVNVVMIGHQLFFVRGQGSEVSI